MNVIKIEPEDTDHKDHQAHRYSERDEAASKGRFAPEAVFKARMRPLDEKAVIPTAMVESQLSA
jgi:hypothetical protein